MPEKHEPRLGCLVAHSSIGSDRVINGNELPAAKLREDGNPHQQDNYPLTHTHSQIGSVRIGARASIASVSSVADGRVSSALSVSLWTLCWRSKRSTRLLSQVNTSPLSERERERKIKRVWSGLTDVKTEVKCFRRQKGRENGSRGSQQGTVSWRRSETS